MGRAVFQPQTEEGRWHFLTIPRSRRNCAALGGPARPSASSEIPVLFPLLPLGMQQLQGSCCGLP